MAQPTPYHPTNDFSSDEASSAPGRSTVETESLDAEFVNIETTLGEILANLADIQRDDGRLMDNVVELHTLSSEVLDLIASGSFTVRGLWTPATAYTKGDIVMSPDTGIVYIAMDTHTSSGDELVDIAALHWGALTKIQAANEVAFNATATIGATDVQAAIEELDDDLRPGQSILHQQLFQGL